MDIVSVQDVTKTYRSPERTYTALRNVDLRVARGAYVAIRGRSGSGKSTLLNLITGIDHPTSGVVQVAGLSLEGLSESELAAFRGRHIGIVFQFFQLIPTLTIEENLLLAMELVDVIPKPERAARARQLLELVGVGAQGDKLPGALSGGEQQRAAIARALANDPPLLVADEPTGNLDSKTADTIHELLRGLARAGKTAIVVTHEREVAGRYDRVIQLEDGRVHDEEATPCA